GGGFQMLGGQPRTYLARLNSTEPATQTLSSDSTSITWLRGDASPEVWRTTFEFSTNNGIVWGNLGSGSRIAGGWQLTGLVLPPGGTVRARGYAVGDRWNGSGWFVETMIGPPAFVRTPSSLTNNAGTFANFIGLAEGSEPLRYFWLKDGVALVDGANI